MARNGWLNKKFYTRYTIDELKKYFEQYTSISDILIEEYGLYSKLPPEIKEQVSTLHPALLSYYDDDWAYVQIKQKRY